MFFPLFKFKTNKTDPNNLKQIKETIMKKLNVSDKDIQINKLTKKISINMKNSKIANLDKLNLSYKKIIKDSKKYKISVSETTAGNIILALHKIMKTRHQKELKKTITVDIKTFSKMKDKIHIVIKTSNFTKELKQNKINFTKKEITSNLHAYPVIKIKHKPQIYFHKSLFKLWGKEKEEILNIAKQNTYKYLRSSNITPEKMNDDKALDDKLNFYMFPLKNNVSSVILFLDKFIPNYHPDKKYLVGIPKEEMCIYWELNKDDVFTQHIFKSTIKSMYKFHIKNTKSLTKQIFVFHKNQLTKFVIPNF